MHNNSPMISGNPAATPDNAFAVFGGSRLAYVRPSRSEDIAFLCPDAPMLAPGRLVFVLCAADGTPILVTDTREAAVASAQVEQLEAMSVH